MKVRATAGWPAGQNCQGVTNKVSRGSNFAFFRLQHPPLSCHDLGFQPTLLRWKVAVCLGRVSRRKSREPGEMSPNLQTWHFNIDKFLNPWIPNPPWRYIPHTVSHMLGKRTKPQKPLGNLVLIFWAFLGVFCGILIIEAATSAVPLFQEQGAQIGRAHV